VALIEHTFNLSGHVRHQGLPLAQVPVFLYDLYSSNYEQSGDPFVRVGETKTGSRGEFTFAVKPGVYRLEVVPDGKTRFLAQIMGEMKVTTNTNLNISLATGCIVSGRVATGFGFEGDRSRLFVACEVVALGIEPTSYKAQAAVDDSGLFSLIIPRGKYYFAVRSVQSPPEQNDRGEAGAVAGDKADNSAPRFIATETQIFNVSGDMELTLGLPSFVTFVGEVVDVFGSAIEGAAVMVVPAVSSQNVLLGELDMVARAITDSSGHFELALQEGLYDLSIEPSRLSNHFAYKESEIAVKADKSGKLTKRFTLEDGHRLKGTVVFRGEALSQALVRVQSVERKNEYIARTDGEGQFALSLPGGQYKIIAVAHPKDAPSIVIDEHEYSSLAPWTRSVVVGDDTQLSIALQEGTALLGRICDDALQARPGVRVQIFENGSGGDQDPPDAGSPVLATGITDGEGRYGVFLSPGDYWLVVHRDFESARFITVENDPVSLDITWHGWSQLTFEVVGDSGHTVPRCQVFYHPYGQEMDDKPPRASSAMPLPYGYVMTTEEGICRLTLPAGVYTFKFVPPIAGSYGPKIIRQLSISSDISRKVTLDAKQSPAAQAAASGAGAEQDS
jgi:hypothetical protein